MAEHDIDKLIAEGRYNLALEDNRLKFKFGSPSESGRSALDRGFGRM